MDEKLFREEWNNNEAELEVQDFGDAVVETKQQAPSFAYFDCLFGFGTKPGC